MARPIWKGHISFGLVSIPVTLFSGEKRTEIHFNMLDSRNNARVRYERVNDVTGEEVPWDVIVKAFEYDKGSYVILKEEDIEKVKVEATQTIEIEDFVDEDDIDYVYFDKPYYLVPGKKGEKGYVLLRETLKRTKKVGIAKVVIRTKQYLAAVIPEGDAMVLDLLRFSQEVRDTKEFDLPTGSLEEYKISARELDMAEQLVASMSSTWEPNKYTDDYRTALLEWIEAQVHADGDVTPPQPEEEHKPAGEIIDIMSLLKQSVEERGKGSSRTAAPAKAKAKPAANSKAKAKPTAKASASRKKASGER